MKMYKISFIIFTLLIFARPSFGRSQPALPAEVPEKVVLITDRSIYITGEQVKFFASVSIGNDFNAPLQSRILYCEIIAPDGNKIAGNKFLIENASVDGCVEIPNSLLTGTYYLRAYTKLMRNSGPETYGYNQIKIINPERIETLTPDNHQNLSVVQIGQNHESENQDILSVSSDKKIYAARDTISVSILQQENNPDNWVNGLCLSVVPENTQSIPVVLQSSKKMLNGKEVYFSETRGLSVTGKITDASTGLPIYDKKVNLSIIGDGRDFMAARTDSLGRFFFALPDYTGARDLFICTEKMDSVKAKIWVDNDYSAVPFRLPSPAFKISDTERETVQNMAMNAQISSVYYNDSLLLITGAKAERLAFYGVPTATIYIDQYIQLPTLEEYFNELPSEVKVRTRKGQPHFAVLGTRGVSFYDPLVMVDWVAIDEPSKVLAVSPQNIQRIEVEKDDYVKGGQTYGGIISIISRKGDFAGIDLPSTGIFVNYQFLDNSNCGTPVYDNINTHPDSRNTILWKPGLRIKSGKSEKYSFTVPDTPGKYNIVLEGINSKGETFSVISAFEVKN